MQKLKKEINKKKLKPLITFDPNMDALIEGAIKDDIFFYIIDKKGNPIPIESGDVARIRNNAPNKVYLNHQANIEFELDFDMNPKEQYDWNSIWVDEDEAKKFLVLQNNSSSIYESNNQLPFLDKNHPNYSNELALAVNCWQELYSNPDKQPTSVEKHVEKIMSRKKITATNAAVTQRIARVITPNVMKTKHGSALSLEHEDQ